MFLCTSYEQFTCTKTSEEKKNFGNAKRIKHLYKWPSMKSKEIKQNMKLHILCNIKLTQNKSKLKRIYFI